MIHVESICQSLSKLKSKPVGGQSNQNGFLFPKPTGLSGELPTQLHAAASRGETPLHRAAYRGHAAIAERLLAAGAAVDAEDVNGWEAPGIGGDFCRSFGGMHGRES